MLGLFPQMQRTTQKLVFVYTQSGGQPSLVLGVELQRQLKCGIYLSGADPWLVFALVPQKPPAFCVSGIILPSAITTRMNYAWDTSLFGTCVDTKKTTLIFCGLKQFCGLDGYNWALLGRACLWSAGVTRA